MATNIPRSTPEKVLFVFAAFLLIAVVASVIDCRARDRLEWIRTVPSE